MKPAYEPIILAMKPLDGTFAENALKWGVAGLNVDGARIGAEARTKTVTSLAPCHGNKLGAAGTAEERRGTGERREYNCGRWPANLLLDEGAAEMLDGQSGELTSGANPARRGSDKLRTDYGTFVGQAECHPIRGANSGGASRFFYVAKSSCAERGGCTHPTMKPLKLCEYLARLLLPLQRDTPRRLLVPFSGSGSEMIGALQAGWEWVVGIDNNLEYCELAKRRILTTITPGSVPAPASPLPGSSGRKR